VACERPTCTAPPIRHHPPIGRCRDHRPGRSPTATRRRSWTHARVPRHRGPAPRQAVRHRQTRRGRRLLQIERGETFALLGPNGAGKSTTVEILEGYRSRTAGEVRVLGHDPARTSRSHNARIGIVLQTSAESPNVTVAEQLNHFATLYPKHRSVEELLTATGLETQRNTRISRLSGGQRRRVDVALGIIGRPEVLFLDEPTTGFDPEARRQFWDLLRRVQHEGTTILLTTHYLDEAAQLADRAAVIADGKLLDLAPIDEIGGAEARTPRVRWRDDDGGHHDERTTDPTALIRSSTAPMHDLEVIRPSLEDVYLDMVGQK